MYLVYQLILLLVITIASPYFLFMAIVEKHGLRDRLGYWKFKPDDRQVVWFHAASMGELKAINSVLPELLQREPEIRVVISTMTKTGRARAQKLFEPIEVYYIPLDLKFCVKHVLKTIKPAMLVLVETEIWPILIREADRANTKLAIINGRLSDSSMKLYKVFGGLFQPVLKRFDTVMTQTKQFRERFIMLGVNPENISAPGNIKFDQVLDQAPKALDHTLEKYLNRHDKFIFIAGSIWPDEFDKVIESIKTLRDKYPELTSILAPRHLKNLSRLEESLRLNSLSFAKRSESDRGSQVSNVMILDSMGELSNLYRYADLAFVGGSFVKVGGHDPLEPASSGCPVCFGPHMENSSTFIDILIGSGGAFYVNTAGELEKLIEKLLSDKAYAREIGHMARQAVLDQAGVSENIAQKLSELI